MDDFDLPSELRELEQTLAARPRPKPPADLRDRVIGNVRAQLPRNGSRSRWSFAAALAVAAAVWINLSLSATLATDVDRPTKSLDPPVDQVTLQIHQLLPELSEKEALRQAVMLRAASQMPAGTLLPSVPPACCLLDDPNNSLLQGD